MQCVRDQVLKQLKHLLYWGGGRFGVVVGFGLGEKKRKVRGCATGGGENIHEALIPSKRIDKKTHGLERVQKKR